MIIPSPSFFQDISSSPNYPPAIPQRNKELLPFVGHRCMLLLLGLHNIGKNSNMNA
jgi:hypothetical protein